MLAVLSWTCTQNKTMPVGLSWDSLKDQASVSIKDPFSPRKKIQMELTMWGESKRSKHLSLLPSNWAHAVLCVQQDRRWLVYFVCLEIVWWWWWWWWEQRWGSGTGTTVPRPAALPELSKKPTLLKKSFTKIVCVHPKCALCQLWL